MQKDLPFVMLNFIQAGPCFQDRKQPQLVQSRLWEATQASRRDGSQNISHPGNPQMVPSETLELGNEPSVMV